MKTKSLCFVLVIVLLCPYTAAQWVQTNGPNGVSVMCFALSGTTLFAGAYGSGVCVYNDSGKSWREVRSTMEGPMFMLFSPPARISLPGPVVASFFPPIVARAGQQSMPA